MRQHSRRTRFALPPARRATVLPAILVAIALLALAGYRYADLMTSEYAAATKSSKMARTRYSPLEPPADMARPRRRATQAKAAIPAASLLGPKFSVLTPVLPRVHNEAGDPT